MCEPATLTAIGSWFAGLGGTTAAAGGAAAAGTAASAGLTAAQMITLGASVAGTGISVIGAMNQASATEQIARNNATMAEHAAKDAQIRGEEEAQAIQRRAAAIKSSQRVGLAAHGLDLRYGTAADLQDQTDFFAQSDVATARTNAGREAWRYRAQGQDFRTQGEAAASNGMLQATGSLISGAGQVADKWYTYKKGR